MAEGPVQIDYATPTRRPALSAAATLSLLFGVASGPLTYALVEGAYGSGLGLSENTTKWLVIGILIIVQTAAMASGFYAGRHAIRSGLLGREIAVFGACAAMTWTILLVTYIVFMAYCGPM